MVEQWYAQREATDPTASFYLEQAAIRNALRHREELGMVGLVLQEKGKIIAMTMGSPLSADTVDVHFEKAVEGYDGAYAIINREFARFIRETYPNILWLNREDDLGIPGLRKAKLSYNPDHLVVKFWAQPREEDDED